MATYLTYDNGSLDSANIADSWLGIKIAETDVTIDKLSTRLLPVGGLLLDYSGVSGDWTDNSWRHYVAERHHDTGAILYDDGHLY